MEKKKLTGNILCIVNQSSKLLGGSNLTTLPGFSTALGVSVALVPIIKEGFRLLCSGNLK